MYIQVDILQTQKCIARYCTHTHTHRCVCVGVGGGVLIICRFEEFLRHARKKTLMLSDEHHTVMNFTVSGRERNSSLSKGLCFYERYAEGSCSEMEQSCLQYKGTIY